ncbi:hypothetical protein ACJIZ3_010094 [Penstemon smallii]|uniref:Uncharacterized protein n=1 Tax=Penstemon smallii TaxID=265156 RepID=A0ABD3TFQ3_9LAMI
MLISGMIEAGNGYESTLRAKYWKTISSSVGWNRNPGVGVLEMNVRQTGGGCDLAFGCDSAGKSPTRPDPPGHPNPNHPDYVTIINLYLIYYIYYYYIIHRGSRLPTADPKFTLFDSSIRRRFFISMYRFGRPAHGNPYSILFL